MKWLCTICNYVHEGDEPPDTCPVCGAGRDAFVPLVEGAQPPAAPDSLEAVRERARELMKGICAAYPWCDGRPENVCNREAYGNPINMGGAGSGTSFRNNVEALARLQLKTSVIGDHFEPDTRTTFLGVGLSMPIMGASTSGVSTYGVIEEDEFCRANVRGCADAGTLSWRGDTHLYPEDATHWGLEAIRAAGGRGIQIFKPRSQDVLKRLIEAAQKAGCPAVGVDLDGCGSTNFARAGKPVYRKSIEDLRELVESTDLPFIAKGVMTADEAELSVEAGVRCVAVSNHGGRVLDHTPGVADVLPEIVERVGKKVAVTADGGVRTGYDAIKLLAIGASAVLVGRDLVRAAIGGGAAGVRMQMERLGSVLAKAMLMTGSRTVRDIRPRILESRSSFQLVCYPEI
jgi:4-hydroxymandelate oxidase